MPDLSPSRAGEGRRAGRELDALIAEKVMGLRIANPPIGTFVEIPGTEEEIHGGTIVETMFTPPYSTDIAAAWLVVEAMVARDTSPHMQYYRSREAWRVEFLRHAETHSDQWAETLPHAICLAALHALEAKP